MTDGADKVHEKELKKQEHAILDCQCFGDGRVIYTVDIDGVEKRVNFSMNTGVRAQFMDAEDWFYRFEPHTGSSWWKISGTGNKITTYMAGQNRIAHLLDRMMARVVSDVILGETDG